MSLNTTVPKLSAKFTNMASLNGKFCFSEIICSCIRLLFMQIHFLIVGLQIIKQAKFNGAVSLSLRWYFC